ncbi:MAG TPA: DEAD/DEAH box helicase [Candidatus Nitrosotenuis sp.]|nr:DEAD/DEAH box helicase [Candidatus Nitrosotenuis sp.]
MRYSCPKCSSQILIQKTFNKKFMVSCQGCGLQDLLEYTKNVDEVYLEFLARFDQGDTPTKKQLGIELRESGIVRDKKEIEAMIAKNPPDPLTKEVLFSKKDYVSYYKTIKEPEPEIGCKVDEMGLDDKLVQYLHQKKIERFYKFQEEAIREILYGQNLVIVAPTASGKTEAFAIPVIQKIANESTKDSVAAIFVYPTKALSRDQLPKIEQMANTVGLRAAVFDGDTKQAERRKLLDEPPEIIVTNFDVLHYHMMYRTKFAALCSVVRFVIVDEAHVYSGIFGSNVHYIIKRLKRLSKQIQFVASSATLQNAQEFCEQLFGAKMQLIEGSGKKGQTDFVMIFPSLRTQRALTIDLLEKLVTKKHKTMVFSNSHLNAELVALQARKKKIDVRVHRAGLMVNYRSYVEKLFKEDKLSAISCTPTLELGIDVGNVDGVISSTIPVNRLMQRIGRAARKGQKGFAFLALGNDPISQYYRNHPEDYFVDEEKLYLDPKNPFVEEFHLLAMACDKPIAMHELPEHQEVIKKHLEEGRLSLQDGRYVPNFDAVKTILDEYSIRGIGKSIDIFYNGKKVGDRILPMALEELHESAVYFLAGTRYKVKEFEYPEKQTAKLVLLPRDYPYYTKALTEEWPTIETVYEQRRAFGIQVFFCKLHIQKRVYGYVNIELGQEVNQGQKILLERPLEYDFVTKGIVIHAPRPQDQIQISENPEYVEASGYHATEHVIIEGSNMITGGVSQDLGGISLGTSGLIFVYDGAIGGNGASKSLYDRLEKAFERSLLIVKECPCKNEAGCPRCTFSYRCGNNNEFLHKKASLEILQRIIDGEKTEIIQPIEGDRPLV